MRARSTRPGRFSTWLVAVALGALSAIAPRPAASQGTLSALETDVDQIARATRPSVVTVFSQTRYAGPTRPGVAPTDRVHTRIGSGVAVEENLLITTASVVAGAERVWIRTTNGLQAEAKVVGFDPISNLAVISVADLRLPTLRFASGDPPQEGEWVMAIGTSHYRAEITQTVGTIAYRHQEPRLSLLQLTNSVYPGYSGGAVVDSHGELIGIVQGGLGRGYDDDSGRASFVLPIETVHPVYESLRDRGHVRHGYLGVSTRAASVKSDTEPGLEVPIGAEVVDVQPGGPAALAGLAPGDLIVAFDQVRVGYPEQLARWVAATPPGTTVELMWVRDEIPKKARVAVTLSPDATPEWAGLPNPPGTRENTRIAELERQIQQLNRELKRLKNEATGPGR